MSESENDLEKEQAACEETAIDVDPLNLDGGYGDEVFPIVMLTNNRSPDGKPSLVVHAGPYCDIDCFDVKGLMQALSIMDLRKLADIRLDLTFFYMTDEDAESICLAEWAALVVDLKLICEKCVTAEGWRNLATLPNLKRLVIDPKDFYSDEEKLQAIASLLPRLTYLVVVAEEYEDDEAEEYDWRLSKNLIGRLRQMCPQMVSITDAHGRQY